VKSGLLAVGGDLSPERLLAAYREGIFPWYAEGEPILWWSPDPRFVLLPNELRVSRSMGQFLKKGLVRITFDQDFRGVIAACQKPRPGQDGTWITGEMQEAYCTLHELGYAHSVEAWRNGALAGGLYGVSLGHTFFGESMFSKLPYASKAALITLIGRLQEWGFDLIDCQVETAHLGSFGARPIRRREFHELLNASLCHETLRGNWGELQKPL
jgi:leucyl/phenylalanyl-tRNA--protein transferase